MKTILRWISYSMISIFTTTIIIPGFIITNDIKTFLIAGAGFTLLNIIVKPLAKIMFFPINLITMGLFTLIINTGLLYILTKIVSGITISNWFFSGFSLMGFVIPSFESSHLVTLFISATMISIINGFLNWIRK